MMQEPTAVSGNRSVGTPTVTCCWVCFQGLFFFLRSPESGLIHGKGREPRVCSSCLLGVGMGPEAGRKLKYLWMRLRKSVSVETSSSFFGDTSTWKVDDKAVLAGDASAAVPAAIEQAASWTCPAELLFALDKPELGYVIQTAFPSRAP